MADGWLPPYFPVIYDSSDENVNATVSEKRLEILVAANDVWAPTCAKAKYVYVQNGRIYFYETYRHKDPFLSTDQALPSLRDPVALSWDLAGWVNWHDFEGRMGDGSEVTFYALAILAETIGGVVRRWWQVLRDDLTCDYSWALQALLVPLVTNDMDRDAPLWDDARLEVVVRLDSAPDRLWKDLSEVMQITLPRFREMNVRIKALSKLHSISYSSDCSDSPSIFGPSTTSNIITCLDVAESVAKLVPLLGDVLEGACGVIRKIVQAADSARAARDECKALAEHTACIAVAILNEIGSKSGCASASMTANVFDLCATIGEVERRISSLSKYGRFKYLTSRGRISAEVKELRMRVDNARVAFKLRANISTCGLLHDLRVTQTRLLMRVDDIYEVQRTMDSKLDMILVKVARGSGGGGAYLEETA